MALNRIGPPCPKCGNDLTGVVTTARDATGGFYRRRHCKQCDHRFLTAQLPEVAVEGHVFFWEKSRLIRIAWRHPALISRLRDLISGKLGQAA